MMTQLTPFGAPFETSDGVFILCDIICTRDARPNGSYPEKRAATHESCRRTLCAEYSMSDANRTNPIFLRPVSSSNKHNHDRTRRLRQERGTTKPDLESMCPTKNRLQPSPLRTGFYRNLRIKRPFRLTIDIPRIANNPIHCNACPLADTHGPPNVKSTRKGIACVDRQTRPLRTTDRIESTRHRHSHT